MPYINVKMVIGETESIEKAALTLADHIIMERIDVDRLTLDVRQVPPEFFTATFTNTLLGELIRYYPLTKIVYILWDARYHSETNLLRELSHLFLEDEAKKRAGQVYVSGSKTPPEADPENIRKAGTRQLRSIAETKTLLDKIQQSVDYAEVERRVSAFLTANGVEPYLTQEEVTRLTSNKSLFDVLEKHLPKNQQEEYSPTGRSLIKKRPP